MKKDIRTVGIIGKLGDPTVGSYLRQLVPYLQGRDLKILFEETTAKMADAPATAARAIESLGRECDIAIVIGGDGTMLRAARQLAEDHVPMMGVNLGRVGFLADIPANDLLQQIGKILDGHGKVTRRMMLQAEVVRAGKRVHEAKALNDVVITKGELARLIEFETWLDGEFVSTARADGVIVATPTGSTAYSLSAGGPILHPDLPAMSLVPICPHTFSHRPIVVSAHSTVEIVMKGAAPGQHAHITFDGQSTLTLEDNDRVQVRQADIAIELVHPPERSHFEVLRTKLHWGRAL